MSEPFRLVSVADFERMTRAEKENYLKALAAHLEAIRQMPIGDSLSLSGTLEPANSEQPS